MNEQTETLATIRLTRPVRRLVDRLAQHAIVTVAGAQYGRRTIVFDTGGVSGHYGTLSVGNRSGRFLQGAAQQDFKSQAEHTITEIDRIESLALLRKFVQRIEIESTFYDGINS